MKLKGYVVLKQLYNGAAWDERRGWEIISRIISRESAEGLANEGGIVPRRVSRQYKPLTKANRRGK